MSETDLVRHIMLAATADGHRLFRNNCGVLNDRNGRPVRFGLGTGTSDLIGFTRSGRFLAVEAKSPKGTATDAQLRFIIAVNEAGGLAGIARSVTEARAIWSDVNER